MQKRIAHSILSILHREGRVRIPGLGVITLTAMAARIDEDLEKVAPPQNFSMFSSGKKSKSRLLEQLIAYRTGSSRTKTRRELARFAASLRSDLELHGTARIDNVGMFFLEGEHLRFVADERYLNPGAVILQPAALPPRLRPHVAEEPVVVALTPQVPSEEEKEEEEETAHTGSEGQRAADIALPVFVPEQKEESVDVPEPLGSEVFAVPAVVASPAQAKKIIPVAPAVAQKNPSRLVIPILGSLLLLLLAGAFLYYGMRMSGHGSERDEQVVTGVPEQQVESPVTTPAETIDAPTEVISEETPVTDPTGHEDHGAVVATETEAITESSGDQIDTPVVPPIHTAADAGTCQVVVGAFSEQANADRMIRRLQALGYEAVIMRRGRLTQVGVPASCEGEQAQALLSALRVNVESQAWVFRPR